jgi:DNA-binding transcriptional LysR family regulator
MNINTLEYFLEVAKQKSISHAAEQLYISQQGLSKAISSLEAELGAQLFVRSQHGLELTNEGNIVAKHATIIMKEYAVMDDKLQRILRVERDGEDAHNEKICVMSYILYEMYPCLKDDIEAAGIESLPIEEISYAQIAEAIKDYDKNKYLTILTALPERCYADVIGSTRMQFYPLFSADMAMLVPRVYSIQSQNQPITPNELANIPFSYLDESISNNFVNWFFQDTNNAFREYLHTNNREKILESVKQEKCAMLTDTFTLRVIGKQDGMVTRIPKPSHRIIVGFFSGIRITKNDPQYQFMTSFQELVRRKYESYIRQHPVPHPNYKWDFGAN